MPSNRSEREELLALLEEKQRREERRRLQNDREAILRNCASLHGFICEFWRVLEPVAPFKTGWALQAMCAHLEAITAGDIRRLLITVPPGMMKSLLMVFWTAWEWGPRGTPHVQVLSTSYSQANALRDNMKLRDLVRSPKFQALWPLTIRDDADAKGKFINTASGFAEARPFSKMTGGRANRVKIDDPHDTEAAESEVQRETAVRIMREAISDRLNDPTSDAIVLIMQRLHAKDCAAAAIDLGYTHLNLPMEFDPGRRCVTPIFTDPRTQEGELLFPERFPPETVATLKNAKGSYAWAGQYQQSPAPRDGGMFKRAWFKPIPALPSDANRTCRGWDFGATEGGGDPSAGVKMAATPDGRFIITDVKRGQWGPASVERELKLTAATDGTACKIRIPQDPGAAGKADAETKIKLLAGYAVKAKPVTGDKEQRAGPLAAQAEAGNVYLLVTGDPARDKWIEPFLDEIAVFPAGSHDDQVDAAADAFLELALGPGPVSIKPLRI
jgi:predicted phage terminase large subunit-like protein